MSEPNSNHPTVYPILWSNDVAALLDWAVATLGVTEVWRNASASGEVDHAELAWRSGRISVNVMRKAYEGMGKACIAICLDDRAQVEASHARAVAAGAEIVQGPAEGTVAFSYTALDPDGNQWWVNAETGMLDQLRGSSAATDA